MKPSTARNLLPNLAIYAVLLAGAAIMVGPYLLSLLTALKTPQQFSSESPLALPSPVTLTNFTTLFGADYDFVSPVVVTIQMVLVILVGQMVFSVFAAYAFARLRFPGREVLFWFFLSTLMVPGIVTLIPLYTMLSTAGLRDTFWGLVLPYMFGSPYAIFLLREYFRSIPEDLVSAAKIDGAGTFRIIRHVIVPMSRPILATLTIITVVTHWNSFLWPLMMTSKDTWWTITVATANLQTEHQGNWTLVMAATTVAMAPLVIVFLVFQRHIVRSIALTGLR